MQLASLFQDVRTKEAFVALAKDGVPELCRIFDQLVDYKEENNNDNSDDLLFVLKIFAMYRTEAGTDRVIAAARKRLKPDGYMWSVVLREYNSKHPHAIRLVTELSDPLPTGFLAVALLDCANALAIGGKDVNVAHPFNSDAGIKQLNAWLTSEDESEYSYAHSAAAAIPFIRKPDREQLLALALDHPRRRADGRGLGSGKGW